LEKGEEKKSTKLNAKKDGGKWRTSKQKQTHRDDLRRKSEEKERRVERKKKKKEEVLGTEIQKSVNLRKRDAKTSAWKGKKYKKRASI